MRNTILIILFFASALTVSAQNKKSNNSDQINSRPVTVNKNATPPALPVLQTYVPPDVVKMAVEKYGSALYCITEVRTADGKKAYMVGVIERGELKSVMITEDLKFA